MKKIISILSIIIFSLGAFAQLNITYQGSLTYSQDLSDIWGYVAPDSTEYALVGVYNGVSIVDLSDPTNPTELFFANGVNSTWRDIKTWGTFAYVTNETGSGVMVIDLSNLPNSIATLNWTPNIGGLGTLSTCHNIFIDEFGFAYLIGCNINNGGMIYVDVFTTPGTPVFVDAGPAIYSHDVYVRDNIAYSSEIYEGHFAIYDVSDKSNSLLLGSQNTASDFTHNSWLSDDSTILFTTDEVANGTVGAYDVSDPTDIQELDQFQPLETLGDGVIPHNVHVWQDWLIVSYYTDGCILVDGSNPTNLIEVGNFDTFIPPSTGFSGAWGAYPYLPSGLILISDIGNGLYVLAPTYVHACWLEGNITDAVTTDPVGGATIIIESTNVVDASSVGGEYATGYAIAGTYDVTVSKPGYESTTVSTDLVNGITTILDVELVPLTPFAVSGFVSESGTGNPIPNAKVSITNGTFIYDVETDATGNFAIPAFYAGDYGVFAGKWGYKYDGMESLAFDELNNTVTLELEEGYEDIFSVDLGWTATADSTTLQGEWERAEPIGQTAGAPFYIAPPMDVDTDIGNSCYVTGNTENFEEGVLLGGSATLTSPVFDLSDYENPYISYDLWHLSFNQLTQTAGGFNMQVSLENGLDTVVVDVLSWNNINDPIVWKHRNIQVNQFLTPTANMKINYRSNSSTGPGYAILSEGGVDHFLVSDSAAVGITEITKENILLNAFPNPSTSAFNVVYELKDNLNNAALILTNAVGQIVEEYSINDRKGIIEVETNLESGLYFARILNGSAHSKTLKLVKQ